MILILELVPDLWTPWMLDTGSKVERCTRVASTGPAPSVKVMKNIQVGMEKGLKMAVHFSTGSGLAITQSR